MNRQRKCEQIKEEKSKGSKYEPYPAFQDPNLKTNSIQGVKWYMPSLDFPISPTIQDIYWEMYSWIELLSN